MTEPTTTDRGTRIAERVREAWKGWLLPALVAVGLSLPLRAALADWYHVPSGSMRPTIIEGDRIWVNNLAFGLRIPLTTSWIARWGEPVRGDIVTLASPEDGKRLVKRVVAVGGDEVELRNNRLLVNGEPIAYSGEHREIIDVDGRPLAVTFADELLPGHPHRVRITGAGGRLRSFPPMTVPTDHVFVMGDNRDMSRDSRYFGPVAADHVYGRGSYVVVSLDPGKAYLPRLNRGFERLD